MQILTPFILGIVFTAMACMQHTHSVRGLWRRSVLTSLGLGAIQFLMVRWAAKGASEFWIFQAGCAVGAGIGSFLSSRLGNFKL